jgi:N-acetyl-gamma-glutamyl-phosphate reductase
MLSTIYFTAEKSAAECEEIVRKTYANEPFVRVRSAKNLPAVKNVACTNYCDIAFTSGVTGGPVIAVCAIDNLVKGASGQALQNMNIMFGLDETMGLK